MDSARKPQRLIIPGPKAKSGAPEKVRRGGGLLLLLALSCGTWACTRGQMNWSIANQGGNGLEISENSGGVNLISNPGFESGMTSWTAQGSSGSSAVVSAPSAPVFAGSYSLEVGTGGMVVQDITAGLVSGASYTFTVESRLASASDLNGMVGIQFLDSNGSLLSQQTLVPLSTNWSEEVIGFVYPFGVAKAQVFVSKSSGASSLYLDNFSLIAQGSFQSTMESYLSGLCLQGSASSGSPVPQEGCGPALSQSFLFQPLLNGTLMIVADQQSNLCLDAPAPQSVGQQVEINPCDGSTTQEWSYFEISGTSGSSGPPTYQGAFQVGTGSGSLCLSESSSSAGAGLVLENCDVPPTSNEGFVIANWGNAYANQDSTPRLPGSSVFLGAILASGTSNCAFPSGGSSSANTDIVLGTCSEMGTPSGAGGSYTFGLGTGGFYMITTSSLCLDFGASSTSGIAVIQNTCSTTSASQAWSVSANPDGSYAVVTSDGKGCLDAAAGVGYPLVTNACNASSPTQRFRTVLPAPSGVDYVDKAILSVISGLSVNVNNASTVAGAGLEQYYSNGLSSEAFNFLSGGGVDYVLIPYGETNLSLDFGNASTAGLQVIQNTSGASASQDWIIQANPDGTYSILTSDGLGCWQVQDDSTMYKAIIETVPCDGSLGQRFSISGL